MEKLFWILEYVKVFLAYFFVTFLWPMVVFRKFLKGKSRTFKFAFCVGPQILLINTVVMLMGLVKVLNPTTFRIVFWGTFIVSAFWNVRPNKKNVLRFKNFFSGTYGIKSAITDILGVMKQFILERFENFKEFIKGRRIEFLLLFLIIVYAVIYFSYGAFYDTSYGTGDLYTHNMWIYDLCNGQIFSHGVYPEGMHCFIGAEHMAFGIDLYSLILFTAGIHVSVIIMAMYIFLKNLFSWKYSAQIALLLYFIIDVRNPDAIFSFCRYQWTLPQEFGYPALFMCATYLLIFLKKKYSPEEIKTKKFWKNPELFIFATTLATTLAVHFYITIMAFLVCVPIAIVLIKSLISKKFMPLFVAALAGVAVAIIPMATAFATGTRLEGSLYWAMSIISPGDEEDEAAEGISSATGNSTDGDNKSDAGNNAEIGADTANGGQTAMNMQEGAVREFADNKLKSEAVKNTGSAYAEPAGLSEEKNADFSFEYPGLTASVQNLSSLAIFSKLFDLCGLFYGRGFELSFGETRARLLFAVFIISILVWAGSFVLKIFLRKKEEEEKIHGRWFDGYLVAIGIAAVYSLMLMLRPLGLPVLIEETRLFPLHELFVYALVAVPVDFIISFFALDRNIIVSSSCGIVGLLAVIFIVKLTGSYHGYLMCQLTRYNDTALVTKSIMNQMKPESYTIVSTTDEIYQFIGHGYHEELISFVNQAEIVSYTLPTEYVYIYVEKNPLSRNQYNCYSGPSWLASEKYHQIFGSGYSSFGRDIAQGTISEDMAQIYFGPFPYSSNVYATLWKRTALMAKTYVWCQKFNEMYPNELHVFYENEDFVCYYFKQNQRNLYELAVMDSSAMIKPSEYPKPFWPANEFSE